ncbi:MAG: PorP/SprF family type IX secretion system membrane protein [Bacteroidia bacterium]
MKHVYKILVGMAFLSIPVALKAQDPQFTQFYANPLYLNPAMAGGKICPRINMNYRKQWPGITGTYSTVGFSYDQFVHQVKGGVGLMVVHDRAGEATLNTTGVGAVYAPIVRLTKNAQISFAIQAGYWQKSVDWSKLNFGDQIDSQRGFIYSTAEQQVVDKVGNFDLSTGTMLTLKNVYIGAAVHHLFEPNESLLGGTSKLPRKYTIHGGGVIPLSKSRYESDTYISPNVLYQQQGDFRQLNLGMYFKKEAIMGGVWYRGNDSFILLVGVEQKQFRVGYSYDLTISKLTNATAGSHELSLGYTLTCKPPKKKYRPDLCPSM